MRKFILSIVFVFAVAIAYSQDTLAKGTIVFVDMDYKLRIGDTSWQYEGDNGSFRYYILKSTKQYPKGIWTVTGDLVPGSCNCVPKRFFSLGYLGRRYYE